MKRKLRSWLEWHTDVVIIVVMFTVIICCCLWKVNYYKTHVEKSEPMAVEILDKKEDSTIVPIRTGKITVMQTRHHYYIDTEVGDFSVGNNVYNKYDKGDIVFVTKTDTYEIRDGKEIYKKTEYEWEN